MCVYDIFSLKHNNNILNALHDLHVYQVANIHVYVVNYLR